MTRSESVDAAAQLVADTEHAWRTSYRVTIPLVYCVSSPGFFKVGMAVNPAARIATIQACCPYPLTLIYTSNGGRATERAIHKCLVKHRLHGEWFIANPESEELLGSIFRRLGGFKDHRA